MTAAGSVEFDEPAFARAEGSLPAYLGTGLKDVAGQLSDPSRLVVARPVELSETQVLGAWAEALRRRDAGEGPETLQLYMHFGYCPMHCRFCQYWHVVPKNDAQLDAFVDSQVAVLERHHARLGRVRASNAYFGGGTPTVIPARGLERVMAAFRRFADVEHEFTCEAHPSTLDDAKIDVLLAAGVNRVSMGVQSLDEKILARVARTSPPMSQTGRFIARLRREGVSVSVDLIAGLPEQTFQSVLDDVAVLLAHGADMITIYRYQPVRGLPENTLSTVYTPALYRAVAPAAVRKGYAPIPLPGGIMLLRPSLRLARRGVLEAVDTHSRRRHVLRRFNHHHSHDTNMIGLGAGAESHCFGFGWFRDVTTVRQGAAPRVYLGTRYDAEAGARAIALTSIAEHGHLDVARLARVTRSPALVDHVVRQAKLAGGAERFGRIRWPRSVRVHADPNGLSPLAPYVRASDDEASATHAELERLRVRDGVTRDLVVVSDDLVREKLQRSDTSSSDAEALAEWIAEAEAAVGARVGESFVVQRIDRTSIRVRSVSGDAALRILVSRPSTGPSYFADGRFAIGYASDVPRSLDAAEQRLLDEVCAITRSFATSDRECGPAATAAAAGERRRAVGRS